jgi:hypothetical protein
MIVLAYLEHAGVALDRKDRATIEITPLNRYHLKDTRLELAPHLTV